MSESPIDRVIDTSGRRPRVQWGKLATSIAAILSLGWIYGVVDFIRSGGLAIVSSLENARSWLVDDLIGLADSSIHLLEDAWLTNMAWLESLDVLAIPVVVVQFIVIAWVLERVWNYAYGIVVGVF